MATSLTIPGTTFSLVTRFKPAESTEPTEEPILDQLNTNTGVERMRFREALRIVLERPFFFDPRNREALRAHLLGTAANRVPALRQTSG